MKQNSYILNLVYLEENGLIKFGWKKNDDISTLKKGSYIVSSCSEKEVYTSISDLYNYIKFSYGKTPENIIKEWSDNIPLFESYLKDTVPSYQESDAFFLIKLCKLCTDTGKEFSFKENKYFVY